MIKTEMYNESTSPQIQIYFNQSDSISIQYLPLNVSIHLSLLFKKKKKPSFLTISIIAGLKLGTELALQVE